MRQFARRSRWPLAWIASLVVVGVVGFQAATWGEDKPQPKERFFELRVYTANEGKLEDLHKRFREHTNRIFQKHGMELVGYWTPVDGEKAKNTLIYVLAYPNRESREKSWQEFRNDPEWKKVSEESHKNGVLVGKVDSTYMKPTDYSPIK